MKTRCYFCCFLVISYISNNCSQSCCCLVWSASVWSHVSKDRRRHLHHSSSHYHHHHVPSIFFLVKIFFKYFKCIARWDLALTCVLERCPASAIILPSRRMRNGETCQTIHARTRFCKGAQVGRVEVRWALPKTNTPSSPHLHFKTNLGKQWSRGSWRHAPFPSRSGRGGWWIINYPAFSF